MKSPITIVLCRSDFSNSGIELDLWDTLTQGLPADQKDEAEIQVVVTHRQISMPVVS